MQTAVTPATPAAMQPRRYFQIETMEDAARRESRRFYFVARQAGLDTRDGMAIRVALSVFFGRFVESRKSLSGGQWSEAAAGVECGILTWQ